MTNNPLEFHFPHRIDNCLNTLAELKAELGYNDDAQAALDMAIDCVEFALDNLTESGPDNE